MAESWSRRGAMDIAMPRMNGIEATTELKKRHPDRLC